MLARIRLCRPNFRVAVAGLTAGAMLFSSACDKVPLTAPGGTVITLFPTSNTVPLNGEIEIVATAIENGTTQTPTTPTTPTNPTTPTTPSTPTTTSNTGAGTPVQNGTLITFTTTIGRIEPSEARTNNGQVRVRLIAGAQSGLATITAFSGGASGKIENLRVGTAAVERVTVTANPTTLPPTGGSTEISARVEDVNGAPVPGVPVTFTATQGSFSANPTNTDSSGVAKTTLTSAQASDVNAIVGGKTQAAATKITLAPRTGIGITPPAGTPTAGTAAAFTIRVAAATTGASLRDVTVTWGDGDRRSLGAISQDTTVVHTYQTEGTYTVRATATDVTGFTETVSTDVFVLPAQPPTVTVTAVPSSATFNQSVRLTANVSGNTSAIVRYDWDFGDGAQPRTAQTVSNQVVVSWTSGASGTKVVGVTVTLANGAQTNGFGTVLISTGGSTVSASNKP